MTEYDKVTQASLNSIYVKAQELDRGHNQNEAPALQPPGVTSDATAHASTHASDCETHASTHASDRETHASDCKTCASDCDMRASDRETHASNH